MKKAKIMLGSIALCAVLGGAFAFKAHNNFSGTYFCTTTTVASVPASQPYSFNANGTLANCRLITSGAGPVTTTIKVVANQ